MASEILIYTTPGCPDCAALKHWLGQRGITYEERDLSQPGMADQAKSRCGVRIAPVTVIGGQCFWGTFAEQKPRLEAVLPG
ncbi:MAG: glutaredoxin family protein [Gammaproteobacteria bacterium]|jgi:glutaredoxin